MLKCRTPNCQFPMPEATFIEFAIYLLETTRTSSSFKLALLFGLDWWSRKAFGDKFWWQKYFTKNIDWKQFGPEASRRSFIRVKTEINECFCHRWVCLLCWLCLPEVHFSSAFYHQNLAFSWNLLLNSCYAKANPQQIGSVPADRSKTAFNSVHQLAVEHACNLCNEN